MRNITQKQIDSIVYFGLLTVTLIFTFFIIYDSFSYSQTARRVPLLVSAVVVLMTMLAFTSSVINQTDLKSRIPERFTKLVQMWDGTPSEETRYDVAKFLTLTGWLVFFIVILYFLGFMVATFIFAFLYTLVNGIPILRALGFSAGMSVFLWYLFDRILDLWLWEGVFDIGGIVI